MSKRNSFIFLALALTISGLLLTRKMTARYDGYLAYNEGWYSSVAVNYDSHSPWDPTRYDGKPDLFIPPLFSYLLYAPYKLFGRHEWAFRTISIGMALLLVAGVFFLGREVYGPRAGIAAAFLAGTSPLLVLAGRNVQTDTTYLCLAVWGVFFYLRYSATGRRAALAASSLAFGLGLLAKQFAGITLAALAGAIALRRRFDPRVSARAIAAAALTVAIPGQYFVYQYLHRHDELVNSTRDGALSTAALPSWGSIATQLRQINMGLGPAFTLLLVFAAAVAISRRRLPSPFISLPLLFHFLFFLVLHKHNYYMLGMIPFGAIAAGRFLCRAEKPAAFAALLAAFTAAGVLWSMMTLGWQKYGYDRFGPMCAYVDSRPGGKTIVVNPTVLSRYEPLIYYYCRTAKIEEGGAVKARAIKRRAGHNVFYLSFDYKLPRVPKRNIRRYRRSSWGPCVLGRHVYFNPYEPMIKSLQKPERIIASTRAKPWCAFEMRPGSEIPSLALVEIPPPRPAVHKDAK